MIGLLLRYVQIEGKLMPVDGGAIKAWLITQIMLIWTFTSIWYSPNGCAGRIGNCLHRPSNLGNFDLLEEGLILSYSMPPNSPGRNCRAGEKRSVVKNGRLMAANQTIS